MQAPRISPIEQEILQLLISKEEMFGLEMVKASSRLKRGTIYVTLGRMEEKGYVTSSQDDDPSQPGMPRRRYNITSLGRRVLDATAAAAVVWSIAMQGA